MFELLNNDHITIYQFSIMLMIGLVSLSLIFALVGASLDAILDGVLPDFDFDVDADANVSAGSIFGWLKLGRVPMTIWLISFLTIFGLMGIGLFVALNALTSIQLSQWISVPISLALAFIVNGMWTEFLSRILPSDSTNVVTLESFIGKSAIMISPYSATTDMIAEAKLVDEHGVEHYIYVKPLPGGEPLKYQQKIHIKSYEETLNHYTAV